MMTAGEFELVRRAKLLNEKESSIKTPLNFPRLPAVFSDSSELLFYDIDCVKNFGANEARKAIGPILDSSFSALQESLIFCSDLTTDEVWSLDGQLVEPSNTLAWASMHKLVVNVVNPSRPEIERISDWLLAILNAASRGESKRKEAREILEGLESQNSEGTLTTVVSLAKVSLV